jgi:phage-related protein
MPSVIDSLTSFISSILSAIASAFSGIIGLFQGLLNAIFGVIGTLFSAVGTSIAGLTQTFEGLLKLLLSKSTLFVKSLASIEAFTDLNMPTGNILVIGLILAVLFIYSVYQQRGGRPITTKKTA